MLLPSLLLFSLPPFISLPNIILIFISDNFPPLNMRNQQANMNNNVMMATPRTSFSMNNHQDLINLIHANNNLIGFTPPPPPFYSSYPPPAAAPPLLPFPVTSIPRHTSLPNSYNNYQTRKPANRTRKHKTKPVVNRPDHPNLAPAAGMPVGPKVSSYPAGNKEIPVISLAADDLFISLLAPPPSSLPLPKFFIGSRPKRAQVMMRSCTAEAAAVSGGNDEGSVDNIGRLLRLP